MARSISASSKIIKGALPPNSNDTFFTLAAACAINNLPIAVEPVKEIFLTFLLPVSSAPILTASPVTTLNKPSGIPASCANAANANAVKGVSGAGFNTTAQPAANAGPHLRVIIAAGKFHGVIAATTPTG